VCLLVHVSGVGWLSVLLVLCPGVETQCHRWSVVQILPHEERFVGIPFLTEMLLLLVFGISEYELPALLLLGAGKLWWEGSIVNRLLLFLGR